MSYEPGRVMALDVGGKRIGVAMSDTLRLLASPHSTIKALPRSVAFERIAALVLQNDVVDIVVGLPLTMSGEIGPQAELIKRFVAELEQHVRVPIHLFDERLTTAEAERVMIDMGLKPEQRRARIDEMAASIILRDYLDNNRSRHNTETD